MDFSNTAVLLRFDRGVLYDFEESIFVAHIRMYQEHMMIERCNGSIENLDYWILDYTDVLEVKLYGAETHIKVKTGFIYLGSVFTRPLQLDNYKKFQKEFLGRLCMVIPVIRDYVPPEIEPADSQSSG